MRYAPKHYTRHFGNLKYLDEGSTVLFMDTEKNLYRYTVETCEIMMPQEVKRIINSEYDLTLFTCTIGGRARVVVRCRELDPNNVTEERAP